jgi:predicted Zn-dependent peptidase
VFIERLDNGLPVIAKTVRNKVVTLDCWVNTGSANEDHTDNGISHFLEHMMFKGTPRYATGDLDKIIMNVGGVWNAGTSKDFTHYYVTVASPFFDTALDAISDMIQHSLIEKAEFDREKLVILEEYRRKQDTPSGVLYDALYETAFSKSPYRQTVLGSFESISALERDQMYNYYERYYTPDNMVLLVIGDIDEKEAIAKVGNSFAQFSRKLQPIENLSRSTSFARGNRATIAQDINETYLGMAFPAPSLSSRDEVFALDCASTILGDGRSSRLYQQVKEQSKTVNSISCGFPTHRYESLFYVFATLEKEKHVAAEQEIQGVCAGLAEKPPSADELAKAQRIISNDFHYSNETNTGQSGTIGYYYTLTGSTDFLETYVDCIRKVTPDQVSAVARKYLTGQPSVVLVQPNNGEGNA